MSYYDELMDLVITEDTIEEYKFRRSLQEGKFIEKIRSLFNKKYQKPEPVQNKVEDAKFDITEVTSVDQFRKLYLGEALCKEGINILEKDDLAQRLANILVNQYHAQEPVHIYWFLGKTVNKIFDLHGSNKYPDNFHFVATDLKAFPSNMMGPVKQYMEFRFFNDIVDNNEYREFVSGKHPYSDQIEWLYDVYAREGARQKPKTNQKASDNKYGIGLNQKDIINQYCK